MEFRRCVNRWSLIVYRILYDQLPTTNYQRQGYSLLELILAMAVGSIILAGAYTASVIISKQHQRISAFSQVQEMGIPTINYLYRSIRMAGYTAMDTTTMTSPMGPITTPITINDSGNSCCDSIWVIYDKDTSTRNRYKYFVAQRSAATVTTPANNALYLTIEQWDSANSIWNATSTTNAIIADHIEDLQFAGSDPNTNNNPRFVDIFMLVRSTSLLPTSVTYTKPAQTVGNYYYNVTDKYHRDEFSATINIRNLR